MASLADRETITAPGVMVLGVPIPGTHIFDGAAAVKGYQLNAMCFSFNEAANRQAFLADEDGYCAKFALTPAQQQAVADRNVLAMIAAGGNIYYLAKLAGIFGLTVQDVGAQQTGMSVDAFKAMLMRSARTEVVVTPARGEG